MKTIYIRGGHALEPGALVLKHHLEAKGHMVVRDKREKFDVIVCWGCSNRDSVVRLNKYPTLNGSANLYNKYEALQRFANCDTPTPTIINLKDAVFHKYLFDKEKPWLARKISHEKGKDIVQCNTWKSIIETADKDEKDFFSIYVPHNLELRAWVFEKKVFAVYNKIFTTPFDAEHPHFGSRWEVRDEKRDDFMEVKALQEVAVRAVKALKLDFGAVDILYGNDRVYYVLEVNSMPDISSLIRVSGIRLANLVSEWAEGGQR